jgi:hypothetical protein
MHRAAPLESEGRPDNYSDEPTQRSTPVTDNPEFDKLWAESIENHIAAMSDVDFADLVKENDRFTTPSRISRTRLPASAQ